MLRQNEIKREALQPDYDKAQSFYGKAEIVTYEGNIKALESYGKEILVIEDGEKIYRTTNIDALFTKTTLRHSREFLAQHFDGSMWGEVWNRVDAPQLKNLQGKTMKEKIKNIPYLYA